MTKILTSINPATEEIINEVNEITPEEVKLIISKSYSTYIEWRKTTFEYRTKLMSNLSQYLLDNKNKLAEVITNEVGKTLVASEKEIEKCALVCKYYAENTKYILENEKVQTDATESYVSFEPLGVLFAVMPWNFPFWQVFRFAAPAIMAGNVGVLKHASNVQMSAHEIEKSFIESGFPENIFSNLPISSSLVEKVIRNPLVRAITLTGSEIAGSEVAKIAASEIKKSVLELGGSDPFIVLADADIDLAVDQAIIGRFQNNAGQSCIASKRFIISNKIANEFNDKLVKKLKSLKVGDPTISETDIGPLATSQMLKDIVDQVDKSVKLGANVIFGGQKIYEKGYYYQPTVITNLKDGMPVYNEEVFGPVFSIINFETEEEAIEIANSTEFGLGSSLFTKDIEKARLISRRIEAGSVFINGVVKSDPRLPFGGIKKSGYGRELSSYGIKEFVNIKSVWIK